MEFELVYIFVGLFLGIGIGWLVAKSRIGTELVEIKAHAAARELAFEEKSELLSAQMENVATRVSQQNSETFLQLAEERLGKVSTSAEKDHEARKKEMEELIKPMTESLSNLDKISQDMEKERAAAYQGMKRHMELLEQNTDRLGKEANALSTALRKSSSVRGDWGEVALRNLLEMAGMTKNTDFFEQKGDEQGKRPDFVVNLPGKGAIPIDAKTTAKHYLESLDEEDPDARSAKISLHAKSMRSRVIELTRKDYLSGVSGKAEFVVMFVPSEALISSAFEVDPSLHSDAMDRGVIIAGPASMIALLKTAALYWQQVRFSEEAAQVVAVSQEFYKRMATWSEHFAEVGKRLNKATEFYNKAVGSWDRNVLPHGKKLEELDINTNQTKTLIEPESITEELRLPSVVSFKDEEE
ncbi:MAG: DNA recombination protein RmuC [Candidatus Thalassarchaeaceae archaeon]